MGHAIHKHMNSFKAQNLLSEDPIANKASAMQMSEGSPTYMKDDPQEKLAKKYKNTRRAAQNRGDIINTPEQIKKIKEDRAAKKAAIEEAKALEEEKK